MNQVYAYLYIQKVSTVDEVDKFEMDLLNQNILYHCFVTHPVLDLLFSNHRWNVEDLFVILSDQVN